MRNTFINRVTRLGLVLACLFLAGHLHAGSKVKVEGSVDDVTLQVDKALKELELETAEAEQKDGWARAAGKNAKGERWEVAINRLNDKECEVQISGDATADANIDERFLRLMQSR